MVNEKSKELKVIPGLVFVNCIFVGGAIGFLINKIAIQLQPLFGALQRY